MDLIGCTTVGYLEHPLERALDGIAASGLEHVELGAIPGYCEHAMPGADAAALTAALSERGLKAHSLSAHSAVATPEGFAHVLACVRTASELGLGIVNTGTGPMEGEAEAVFYENAGRILAEAERVGVVVGWETQDTAMTSGPAAVALIERLDSPSARINLDAANIVYWGGRSPEVEVEAMAPYVVHAHLKDKRGGRGEYDFPPVGSGEIDFASILATLDAAGFEGPLIIEPELSAPLEQRPPEQVAEARTDPGSAYLTHTYLGTDDPDLVDADLRSSVAALAALRGGTA